MATMTLLEMTQNILSAMESDKINSIGDTEESNQVAEVIRETYFDLIAGRDWPFLKVYTTLTAVGDVTLPTKMQFPTGVNKVYWIKYNKLNVTWMEPKDFQDLIDLRAPLASVVDSNGYILNRDPLYWTSFDDNFVFFDSINLANESTLQASKSKAYMLSIPSWSVTNNFVPTLPEKMFPLLLADAKGTCFLNFKQTNHSKEERKAQRLKVRMQNESFRNDQAEPKTNTNVNYGRK